MLLVFIRRTAGHALKWAQVRMHTHVLYQTTGSIKGLLADVTRPCPVSCIVYNINVFLKALLRLVPFSTEKTDKGMAHKGQSLTTGHIFYLNYLKGSFVVGFRSIVAEDMLFGQVFGRTTMPTQITTIHVHQWEVLHIR